MRLIKNSKQRKVKVSIYGEKNGKKQYRFFSIALEKTETIDTVFSKLQELIETE
jgi:hypothetical protein